MMKGRTERDAPLMVLPPFSGTICDVESGLTLSGRLVTPMTFRRLHSCPSSESWDTLLSPASHPLLEILSLAKSHCSSRLIITGSGDASLLLASLGIAFEKGPGFLLVPASALFDFSPLRNLLIWGGRGVGKSTLVKSLLPGQGKPTGFLTEKKGERVFMRPFGGDGREVVGTCAEGHGRGIPSVFDSWGTECLSRSGRWRVMDEVGFLENDAPAFQRAVFSALHDSVPTFCVVKDRVTPFLSALRRDSSSLSLRLTEENRDAWTRELKRAIPVAGKWLFARLLQPFLTASR